MMISGQSAASTAVAVKSAKISADACTNGAASGGPSTSAGGSAVRKDFATVAKDARAALDAVYQQRGKAMDMHTSGKDWEAAFQGMDRRALYAIASNAGGQFSKDEQGAAAFLMGKQVEQAQGIDSAIPAGIAAFQGNLANAMKAGAKFRFRCKVCRQTRSAAAAASSGSNTEQISDEGRLGGHVVGGHGGNLPLAHRRQDIVAGDRPARGVEALEAELIGNCRYQRTAHRITSAVNCRPLNGLLLLRITVSPQPSNAAGFHLISSCHQTLQRNRPEWTGRPCRYSQLVFS